MLTCAQLDQLLAKAWDDPAPLLTNAFHITTKGLPGQPPVTTLMPNLPQRKVLDAIRDQRRRGMPGRVIIDKSRQPGISTLCEALVTLTALRMPHTTSMVLTHLDEASEKLFQKCTFMVDHLPPQLKPAELRRKTDLLSLDFIRCGDGIARLNSQIHVATASGREVWRSMTLRTVHLSEFSRFPYPAATLAGIMQTVPKTPDSLVMIESTANGEGDVFHREWLRAINGESEFTPVFIPWFELPDAQLPVPKGFRLTDDERDIQRQFKLSMPQMSWFRYVLRSDCQGDIDVFHQEYPATWQESFLTSGNPAFPPKPLAEMAEKAETRTGRRGDVMRVGEQVVFIDNPRGGLTVYKAPRPGAEYTIGADTSAGVDGGDYSCAQVFDREEQEIVATWHGHISPILFAERLYSLGFYYNEAIMAPEINRHGYIVMDELRRLGYPRFYQFQRLDKIRGTTTNYLGWETNMRTRSILVDTMHWYVGQGHIMIWDLPTIHELRLMRYTLDQSKAEGVGHDDRAMAAMIALRAHLDTPDSRTGLLPRFATSETAPPPSGKPPLPPNPNDAAVWKDTDQVLQGLVNGRERQMSVYNPAVQEAVEEWSPGGESWMPEVPW